jgi:hypothetical protein
MWDNLDYSELNELLRDAIEAQDITLYNRVKAELSKRTAQYE